MLWKIKGSRHLACGGAPTLPDFRVHHRLHPGRVRPLTGARSRAGNKWGDQVFITYRSSQGFSLKVPESWTRM